MFNSDKQVIVGKATFLGWPKGIVSDLLISPPSNVARVILS